MAGNNENSVKPKKGGRGKPFQPGQSGNPSGRPKMDRTLAELAREHTQESLDTLVDIMRNGKNDSARAKAAEVILDRGWGKAPQTIELTKPDPAKLPDDALKAEAQRILEQYRQEQQQEPAPDSQVH